MSDSFTSQPATDSNIDLKDDIRINNSTTMEDQGEDYSNGRSSHANSDEVCSNHSYADSLEMSSSSGSCNSIKETKHYFNIPGERGGVNNATLQKQKSESSCADVNGNSRIGSTDTAKQRRPPSMAAQSKNVSAMKAFSFSMDAGTGYNRHEKCHDATECVKDAAILYLTPLQRKDRERKEMKKEMSRLYNELAQKDEKIFQLKLQLEEQTTKQKEEMTKKTSELKEVRQQLVKLEESKRQEKLAMEEELNKIDNMFTELKLKKKMQEDQFQERFLDMYKRGHKAALFEREQELEMIASSKQPKVTVKELTRKLSRTESELAKWQNLKLDETYKSAERPATDADVTLSFLKDSFYHFVCDRQDCLRHFRAIVEIYKYSDTQMATIRKAVSDSKELSRLFKKEID